MGAVGNLHGDHHRHGNRQLNRSRPISFLRFRLTGKRLGAAIAALFLNINKMNKKIKPTITGILFASLLFSFAAVPKRISAYEIVNINTEQKNDFVLEPAKIEVSLDPGQSTVKKLSITNRMATKRKFKVEIEDFTGSKTGQQTVILLGDEKGPYSLKDYLKPEVEEFSLKPKQKIIIPIEIAIPKDAQPGGLYGSVLISSMPDDSEKTREAETGARGGAITISRLGALFFVRVNGVVDQKGSLRDFRIVPSKKIFYQGSPRGFEILFENKGSVHLNPYGVIRIKNLLGSVVGEIKVDPYFVMPDSLRYRQVKWDKKILTGKYEATALINRGYGDIVDEKTITFWVFPWKILAGVFGVIFLISLIVKLFFSKFEIKKKG